MMHHSEEQEELEEEEAGKIIPPPGRQRAIEEAAVPARDSPRRVIVDVCFHLQRHRQPRHTPGGPHNSRHRCFTGAVAGTGTGTGVVGSGGSKGRWSRKKKTNITYISTPRLHPQPSEGFPVLSTTTRCSGMRGAARRRRKRKKEEAAEQVPILGEFRHDAEPEVGKERVTRAASLGVPCTPSPSVATKDPKLGAPA